MTMTFRSAVLGLVTAASVAVTALIPGTASAAFTDCPSGYMCLWEHPGFSGQFFAKATGRSDLRQYAFDNKASAAYNRGTTRMVIYEHPNNRGTAVCLYPGVFVGDLKRYGFDNKASSIARASQCPQGAMVFTRSV